VSVDNLEHHETLIDAMMDPHRWPQGGTDRRRIDTHISSVILAGEHAYKIKKPVELGFLDFLSLESRRLACKEELRLNRRLAPDIYQAVVPITGTPESPDVSGKGDPIDWAVQMRRFDPDALLSNPEQPLNTDLILALAERVATFHQQAAVSDGKFGTPDQAFAAMQGNFDSLRAQGKSNSALEILEGWSSRQFHRLQPLMQERLMHGRVRECHGDLHLGNIALVDTQPLVFDAIEFNPSFRWIDTISDIAFLTMDLRHRGRSELAFMFLDRYLQEYGDYPGLALLRLYEIYRALVRAKVAAIRQSQPELTPGQRKQLQEELDSYIQLAGEIAQEKQPGIIITHGVSGSGKSWATRNLPGQLPAIRIRSDVERKRLLNLDPQASASDIGGYSPQMTERTYQRLLQLTKLISQAGYVAVVDATFLKRSHREPFEKLAQRQGIPYVIVDCDAPTEQLRARIESRKQSKENVSDADIEVMLMQQRSREPLTKTERSKSLALPLSGGLSTEQLKQRLQIALQSTDEN